MLPNGHGMLRTLQAELNFLERGGYQRSVRHPWRSPYIFEESPSCPNFGNPVRPHPCKDCWLLRFVPVDVQEEEAPCRFIPLTAEGVTVDSLYRTGTPSETEEVLRAWLRQRIQETQQQLSDVDRLPRIANG